MNFKLTPNYNPNISTPFNRLIGLNVNGILSLYDFLNSATFIDNIKLLFATPSEYVSSLKAYPFDVRNFFTQVNAVEDVRIGGIGNSGIDGWALANDRANVLVNQFTINGRYNNFLDYAPYTTLQLYLPYYGMVTLPTNDVMNRIVKVYYSLDFYTGTLTIFITATREDSEVLILSVESKIGIDIPIGTSNFNEISKNILMTGVGIAGGVIGIASGNAPVVASTSLLALNSGVNMVNSLQQHISLGTIGDGRNALASFQKVTLIKKYPIIVDDENYKEFKGKPLGVKKQLNELLGYTQCEEVHFVPFTTTPTSAEIDEIESLLRSGVIIHG